MAFAIAAESPDQAEVVALLQDADRYYATLYAPDQNHLLDVASLKRPQVTFLVARQAGRACGFGAIVDHGDWAEIKRMYVDPGARGQGLARQLLQLLEDRARSAGLRVVRLETGVRQPAALALYRRAGYRDRNPFPPYAPDPMSVFMEKTLG